MIPWLNHVEQFIENEGKNMKHGETKQIHFAFPIPNLLWWKWCSMSRQADTNPKRPRPSSSNGGNDLEHQGGCESLSMGIYLLSIIYVLSILISTLLSNAVGCCQVLSIVIDCYLLLSIAKYCYLLWSIVFHFS